MVTVPLTDGLILANGAELERLDAYNKQLYSVLFLSFEGAANSFLIRFAGRPDTRQQPDGLAGGLEGNGQKIYQFVHAAAACSDSQTERHGHKAKLRPRGIPCRGCSVVRWAQGHR